MTKASLQLPLKNRLPDETVEFPPVETSQPWQTEVLRESSFRREIDYQPESGETVTRIYNDFGDNKDLKHRLRSGECVRETWTIKDDDPLSARAEIEWEQTGGRDDWHWKTQVRVNMHCDAEHFYTTATLTVYNDDTQIFDRKYEDRIKRVAV